MREIVESYPQYGDCPCCGDRWYISFWGDGDAVPSRYNQPVTIVEGDAEASADTIIYFKDGTKKFADS